MAQIQTCGEISPSALQHLLIYNAVNIINIIIVNIMSTDLYLDFIVLTFWVCYLGYGSSCKCILDEITRHEIKTGIKKGNG